MMADTFIDISFSENVLKRIGASGACRSKQRARHCPGTFSRRPEPTFRFERPGFSLNGRLVPGRADAASWFAQRRERRRGWLGSLVRPFRRWLVTWTRQ